VNPKKAMLDFNGDRITQMKGEAVLRSIPLLWLVSLKACQQFFLQPSPALPEPLNLRFEIIEELDHLVILVTKRVEPCVRRR
jgi:hypothetical protein